MFTIESADPDASFRSPLSCDKSQLVIESLCPAFSSQISAPSNVSKQNHLFGVSVVYDQSRKDLSREPDTINGGFKPSMPLESPGGWLQRHVTQSLCPLKDCIFFHDDTISASDSSGLPPTVKFRNFL
jgi:hypothetical protein